MASSALAQMLAAAQGASLPQAPFRAQVMPTDVEKAYSDYNNAMMQAYAAQVGQQNAMFGGLAGLGSAGMLTLPKLLSGAGTAAAGAGAAAPAAAAGGSDALASILPFMIA